MKVNITDESTGVVKTYHYTIIGWAFGRFILVNRHFNNAWSRVYDSGVCWIKVDFYLFGLICTIKKID